MNSHLLAINFRLCSLSLEKTASYIGHFQSIKPAVLHVFLLITNDKTDCFSPVIFSNYNT